MVDVLTWLEAHCFPASVSGVKHRLQLHLALKYMRLLTDHLPPPPPPRPPAAVATTTTAAAKKAAAAKTASAATRAGATAAAAAGAAPGGSSSSGSSSCGNGGGRLLRQQLVDLGAVSALLALLGSESGGVVQLALGVLANLVRGDGDAKAHVLVSPAKGSIGRARERVERG